MKCLITGATGFVGANLAHRLVATEQNEVFAIVRKTSNMSRISKIMDRLNIVTGEISDRQEVFRVFEAIRPDVVFHVATYGGFPAEQDISMTINTNLVGTINMLDSAVKNGVGCFINTGSSSEYGLKSVKMREDDICEPVNLYGITKLAATNYCTMIGKEKNFRVCTLRLFSPYGEFESDSRLYPAIVKALIQDESPKLSRPDSVRDFISVEKVVDVYLAIVNKEFACGDIINVGNGRQQTIAEFCRMVAKSLGKEYIEPIWGTAAPRANEPVCWEADITKLTKIMGW